MLPENFFDFPLTEMKFLINDYKIPTTLLKNYSETHGTGFEGNEAQLSALIIQSIVLDTQCIPFTSSSQKMTFRAVFSLKYEC